MPFCLHEQIIYNIFEAFDPYSVMGHKISNLKNDICCLISINITGVDKDSCCEGWLPLKIPKSNSLLLYKQWKKSQQQLIKCRIKLASVWVYKKKIWSMDSRRKGFLYGSYKHWVNFNIFCRRVWFIAPVVLFSSKKLSHYCIQQVWKLRRTRFYYFLHTAFTRE